jgi:acetyl esterase/lipase
MSWLADDLTALGYAVVVPSCGPPGFIADNALCALAWLHGNVETYGLDPERIAVFGHSGGGTLGVLMAAIDEPAEFLHECAYDLPKSGAVKGVISYAGSFLMPEWYLTQGKDLLELVLTQELQVSREEAEEIRQALLDTPFERWLDITDFGDNVTHFIHMLPPAWIDGSEPPMLLIHGGSDNMIGRLESEAFAELLEAEGVEVRLLIIPSADHDLSPNTPGFEETWNATHAFLAEILE